MVIELNGKEVFIDELCIPTIKILNKKGYITALSCEGHLLDDPKELWYPYIGFSNKLSKKAIAKVKEVLAPVITSQSMTCYGEECIYFNTKNTDNMYDFNIYKVSLWKTIETLVKELPDVKDLK